MKDGWIKFAGIVQALLVLLVNPIIVSIVLKKLYGKIGRRHPEARPMFIKILLLGSMFEIAICLRMVLLLK